MNTFFFTLQPTYYKTGFFNVNVENEKYFGLDNETIEIYCENNSEQIVGRINRTANTNCTPRIMVCTPMEVLDNE